MQKGQQKPTPIREIDFSHYVKHYTRLLWRWKWWIVIIGPLVSAAVLIYLLKFYSSNPELPSTVLIGLENPPTVTIGMDFIDIDNSKAEIIKTRNFLKDIVNKLSLRLSIKKYSRSEVFSTIKADSTARSGKYVFSLNKENKDLYSIAFKNKKSGYRNRIIGSGKLGTLDSINFPGIHLRFTRSFLQEPHDFKFHIVTMESAIEWLHREVTIHKPDIRQQRFHIEVTMAGRDYNLIADILNTIADAFVEKKLLFLKRKTQSVLSVLEKQYNKARNELAGTEGRLKNFRTSNPTVGLTQSAQRTVNTMTEMETDVFNFKNALKEAQRLESKYSEAMNEDRIQIAEEILIFLNSQQSTSAPVLQMELNRLVSDKRVLQNEYSATHPLVRENKASIESLLVKVNNALKIFKNSTEEKTTERTSGIQSLSQKLQGLPSKEVRMAELQRRHQVSSEIFSTVSDRYNQAKVAETIGC